jgi:hypothetical protein
MRGLHDASTLYLSDTKMTRRTNIMAHEFESGFYTRKPAWHGLGTVLKDAPTIEEALIKR